MFKTEAAAKWLEGVKKNALVDILEKRYRQMFKKPTLKVPLVNLSSKVLMELEKQKLEMERKKAEALQYAQRMQLR